ncbi:MAG TPA: molybdopterin-dependent oxidoreductase [Ktedonobacterales bacterium]|nr:molybdopterin-dependent oxidoreductase [Ktedonobacterales bacterium]
MDHMDEPATTRVSYLTCPLCEATCGLEVTTSGRDVISIRGDREDVFSHGYLCPKASALKALDADPDRLRAPMIRQGDQWREASWDDAWAEVERLLPPLIERYGHDAVAIYLGNPNVHNLSGLLYNTPLIRALRTHNVYSASTLDQMPKQVAAGLMFGGPFTIPIPDVDRCDYLLILGANPLVSNGSLLTAPNMRDRLRGLRARGGRVVVIDPRRTRTAQEADEHYGIQPGTDALLLFALIQTLFAEGLTQPGRLADHLNGLDELRAAAEPFTPEAVASACRIEAETIRRLARELASAEHPAVYSRIGACAQEFGTLASWLVDALNLLVGALDHAGGVMFPKAAAGARNTSGTPGRGRGLRLGRTRSRVRGAPEVLGELPAACLAEEMETPGEGQVRGFITVAGNPALSAPNGDRLAAALAGLEAMVSVDAYLNETTRHAQVILPPPSPMERGHYDLAFYQLSTRNIARYSPPIFPRAPGQPDEWEILLRLTGILAGQGRAVPLAALDATVARQLIQAEVRTEGSPVAGREVDELLAALAPRVGPERLLDFMLRVGPYGDGFGARADGPTLAALERKPHGVDLGPLEPRIPEVLRTPSGKIELAPEPLLADVVRLRQALERPRPELILIGRRELRSNNSWMANLEPLVKGDDACALLVSQSDAARLGLADGGQARVTSAVASLVAPVRVTDEMTPGVVSLPHGWGHDQPGARLRVAREHAGVNLNRLIPDQGIEPLSGDALLNSTPVTVEPL